MENNLNQYELNNFELQKEHFNFVQKSPIFSNQFQMNDYNNYNNNNLKNPFASNPSDRFKVPPKYSDEEIFNYNEQKNVNLEMNYQNYQEIAPKRTVHSSKMLRQSMENVFSTNMPMY